jgi:DNA-binding NarL/FixJ family response regulator
MPGATCGATFQAGEGATMTRILVADDHEVVRRGVRKLLQSRPGWEVCGEASNGDETVAAAELQHPDVVILDVMMPGLAGIAAARAIRARVPHAEVLVFTMHETDELLADALASGAQGYVLKSDPSRQLLAAVEALSHHAPYVTPSVSDAYARRARRSANPGGHLLLTSREREVVQLLALGQPNRKVAISLGISVKTVESHRANVMRKLELGSIVDLVRYAVRNRLVDA